MADRLVAIVLAGGSGTRMGADGNKVYLTVAGRAVLAYSLATLQASDVVDDIVLVGRTDDLDLARRLVDECAITKLRATVPGGSSRHRSEQAGLAAVGALAQRKPGAIGYVLIHDAARPFLTHALLDALVDAARRVGGAIPALALTEQPFEQRGSSLVAVPFDDLVRVQTPQVFAVDALLHAYAQAAAAGFDGVDTAQTVERYGDLSVAAVPGDPRNIKLTTAADLVVAGDLALRWRDGAWLDS